VKHEILHIGLMPMSHHHGATTAATRAAVLLLTTAGGLLLSSSAAAGSASPSSPSPPAPAAGPQASACKLFAPATTTVPAAAAAAAGGAPAQQCWEWDLSQVPAHSWPLNTSTCPRLCNAFLVANPCALAANVSCQHGLGSGRPAPAYQISNADGSCYALGSLTQPTFSPLAHDAREGDGTPPPGVRLEYHGGDSGRTLVYELSCNDNDQGGPDVGYGVEETHEVYTVQWAHKAFCAKKVSATGGGHCPAAPPPNPPGPAPPHHPPGPPRPPLPPPPYGTVPLPTAPQLAYYRSEIRALIHFNMATFIRDGDPGCSADNWNTHKPYAAGLASDPATFNPKLLNFSNWIEIMKVVGIRNAVMTAKHGCGHLLWPTAVKLPGGAEYTYCVGKAKSSVKFDLIKEYVQAMRSEEMEVGFYYSLTNNYFMNVRGKVANGARGWLPGMAENVTQEEFERIAFAQLSELWQNYGDYSEVWLDGGYPLSMLVEMRQHLPGWQPKAVAWNGLGSYDPRNNDTVLSKSPVRWIGTESGLPKADDIWSTATQAKDYSGTGDQNSPVFAPPGCDTIMQVHGWFWMGHTVRSLSDLKEVYHTTVGRNCVIELDFAIDRDGLVDPAHGARYRQFGDWISSCYGGAPEFNSRAVAHVADQLVACSSATACSNQTLEITPADGKIDRVMISEDIAHGQRIRGYHVAAKVGSVWKTISSGQSVGNKRIDLLAEPIRASALVLTVTANQAAPIYLKFFGAYAPCE
jgi:alpha-L-fucosidase